MCGNYCAWSESSVKWPIRYPSSTVIFSHTHLSSISINTEHEACTASSTQSPGAPIVQQLDIFEAKTPDGYCWYLITPVSPSSQSNLHPAHRRLLYIEANSTELQYACRLYLVWVWYGQILCREGLGATLWQKLHSCTRYVFPSRHSFEIQVLFIHQKHVASKWVYS